MWSVESTSPRGHYPLARITSLNYGKDKVARRSTNYTQPLIKLVPVLAPSETEDVNAT